MNIIKAHLHTSHPLTSLTTQHAAPTLMQTRLTSCFGPWQGSGESTLQAVTPYPGCWSRGAPEHLLHWCALQGRTSAFATKNEQPNANITTMIITSKTKVSLQFYMYVYMYFYFLLCNTTANMLKAHSQDESSFTLESKYCKFQSANF